MVVGVISDTHGLLRPEALEALRGVEHILHAGDVGSFDILERLKVIAPVTAVRGNVDTHGACAELPGTEMVELDGCYVYMVHAREWMDIVPKAAGVGLVVYGHSHEPGVERRDGVVYLNPGSAGPRRFKLPVSVARVRIDDGVVEAEIVELG
ncbi:YfcE family phosphodiesterase [Granulicella sp. 5B5]|uniref:metallophosphoesterase family protein n=1 Tax=Granulicella sp. 5B5 TaxID=1617967 RepID=UPI0015F3F86F|nr:metallophosphoesterase family protein [Granulicella sp. 5B5]QMV17428.1 YfcE family phosphodiesterase [Granulicella sp. 5B5]